LELGSRSLVGPGRTFPEELASGEQFRLDLFTTTGEQVGTEVSLIGEDSEGNSYAGDERNDGASGQRRLEPAPLAFRLVVRGDHPNGHFHRFDWSGPFEVIRFPRLGSF